MDYAIVLLIKVHHIVEGARIIYPTARNAFSHFIVLNIIKEFITIIWLIIIIKKYVLNVFQVIKLTVVEVIFTAMRVVIQIVKCVMLLQVRHADNVKEDIVFYYLLLGALVKGIGVLFE